jgi:hypothetical protein
MFYPNHYIRTYCLYLGSLEYNGKKLDMGVYEYEGNVSHAIVYGEKDYEYMSGIINFEDDNYNFQGVPYKINMLLYQDHVKRKQKA